MKVWYLHGLESTVGGPKVDFLKEVADEVFAPAMDYTNHRLFGELYRKIIKEGKPDLIIGSSMGGYFADAIASHFDIEVLLFNPALHSRSIEINLPYGETNWVRHMVVGTEDKVIDPKLTKVLKGLFDTWIEIKGMGHRTTLSVFKDIYKKVINPLV
jgi:predicted esterase YcpF (UPF0227 family)